MKTFDFTQLGGFKLTQDKMKFLQEGIQDSFGAIASVVSDDYVALSGCEYDGGAIASGWAIWNGEVLPLEGGTFTTTQHLLKVEILASPIEYIDGSMKSSQITKKVVIDEVAGTVACTDIVPFGVSVLKRHTQRRWADAVPYSAGASVKYCIDEATRLVHVVGSCGFINESYREQAIIVAEGLPVPLENSLNIACGFSVQLSSSEGEAAKDPFGHYYRETSGFISRDGSLWVAPKPLDDSYVDGTMFVLSDFSWNFSFTYPY